MVLRWLFRRDRRLEPEADTVAVDGAGKLAAIAATAAAAREHGLVVLLAHFPATLRQLTEVGRGLGAEAPASASSLAAALARPRAGQVILALARDLPTLAVEPTPGTTPEITVLVAERHPVRERDQAITSALAPLPFASSLRFFLALDDPLLARFVSPGLEPMLAALGLGPGETITSPLVDRSIARAQQRIARQAGADLDADSAEGWLAQMGQG